MIGNDAVCDCQGAANAGMDSVFIRSAQSPKGRATLPPNCKRIVKRVDREPGSCYDAEEFFRLTRPRYPEGVIEEGMVRGYDNEMVIRYLDRVIVNDQDYEVRFKGGITVTV